MKIRLGVPVLTLIIIGLRLISHFQVIVMLPAQLMWCNSYSLLLGWGDLAAEIWPPKECFRVVTSVSLCQFCIWKDNCGARLRNTSFLLTNPAVDIIILTEKLKYLSNDNSTLMLIKGY